MQQHVCIRLFPSFIILIKGLAIKYIEIIIHHNIQTILIFQAMKWQKENVNSNNNI